MIQVLGQQEDRRGDDAKEHVPDAFVGEAGLVGVLVLEVPQERRPGVGPGAEAPRVDVGRGADEVGRRPVGEARGRERQRPFARGVVELPGEEPGQDDEGEADAQRLDDDELEPDREGAVGEPGRRQARAPLGSALEEVDAADGEDEDTGANL